MKKDHWNLKEAKLAFPVYTISIYSYLTDILKTNLTKFAVIWVNRRQKAQKQR